MRFTRRVKQMVALAATEQHDNQQVFSKEGHMAGTTFGIGAPFTSVTPSLTPWALSPYGIQGQGIGPTALQSFGGQSPYSLHPLQQQLYQLLQIVPQQLQTLQQLEYVQQQQLQQLAQIIPVQLAQLQQLVHAVLQQLPQTQQPLGQFSGIGSYGMASPWGMTPQPFGNQPAQVM